MPKYTATSVNIHPADNGYIIALGGYDSGINLVALSWPDVLAILADTDVKVGPRMYGADSVAPIPTR